MVDPIMSVSIDLQEKNKREPDNGNGIPYPEQTE
jgi:hypothetical protein